MKVETFDAGNGITVAYFADCSGSQSGRTKELALDRLASHYNIHRSSFEVTDRDDISQLIAAASEG